MVSEIEEAIRLYIEMLDDDARAVTDLADFVENCKKPLFFVGDGAGLSIRYSSEISRLRRLRMLRAASMAAWRITVLQKASCVCRICS